MMGLAWDSLWHAIISPQQASDLARRVWQVEHDALMAAIEAGVGDPPMLGSVDLSNDGSVGIDFELGLRFTKAGMEGYDPDKSDVSL
jgi:hypothetical protein